MRQGVIILAAGCVRSKKKKRKKRHWKKICPTQNTPRNPQQPENRVQLETWCEGTRPTRYPILSRFHRYSQSVKTTKVTHTLTDIQTDQLNNGTLYAPRYEEAFLPIGKKRPHYEEASLPIGKKRPRSLRSLGLASLQKTPSVASLLRPFLIKRVTRIQWFKTWMVLSNMRGYWQNYWFWHMSPSGESFHGWSRMN